MPSGENNPENSPSKTPAKSSKPSTEPTSETRDPTHQVYLWILAGQHEADILEAMKHHFPELDADTVIVQCVERIAAQGRPSADLVRGLCFEQTREIYRRMMEIGDFAGALKAVKLMMEIGG